MRVKPRNSEPKAAKNEKVNKNTIAVKVQSHPSTSNKGHNKENENANKKVYNNSVVKRNFGSTSIWWGASSTEAQIQKFQYPTYFPVTDWTKVEQQKK